MSISEYVNVTAGTPDGPIPQLLMRGPKKWPVSSRVVSSDRSPVGDGVAHRFGHRLDELAVGMGAEGVVHGGEGDAQGDEQGDREDLLVVEAGRPQTLDVV